MYLRLCYIIESPPALPQNVDLGLIFCHILHIANNRGAKLYQASSFAQLQNATKKNKEELYLGYNSATVILRERSLNDVQLDRCATVDWAWCSCLLAKRNILGKPAISGVVK